MAAVCSNLYTLEGGVHNYLRQEGGAAWNGSLFVFDDRLAVPAALEGGAPGTLLQWSSSSLPRSCGCDSLC